jgi:hypothetical protein
MSARYSNTSSRGLDIVVDTVKGSTTEILWSEVVSGGASVGDPHRMTEFRSMDQAGAKRRIALRGPAELAEHRAGVVDVDSFPDQRGTVTPFAPFTTGGALLDSSLEESEFQIRDVVNVNGGAHRGSNSAALGPFLLPLILPKLYCCTPSRSASRSLSSV